VFALPAGSTTRRPALRKSQLPGDAPTPAGCQFDKAECGNALLQLARGVLCTNLAGAGTLLHTCDVKPTAKTAQLR
jgi:hypothetical protein